MEHVLALDAAALGWEMHLLASAGDALVSALLAKRTGDVVQ